MLSIVTNSLIPERSCQPAMYGVGTALSVPSRFMKGITAVIKEGVVMEVCR